MSTDFRPMGAATVNDLETEVHFPVLASPKLDGIRCSVRAGVAYSKSMKPLPNEWLQKQARTNVYNGFDFEIIVGAPTALDVWNRSQSFAMSKAKTPESSHVRFYVFDDHSIPELQKRARLASVRRRCEHLQGAVAVEHEVMKDAADLSGYEEYVVTEGYEGLMLSDPNGAYKFGRSTLREQGLMKFKRFVDAEAVILGYFEEEHNANAATTGALGGTVRSSAKAGKIGKGTLGGFLVQDLTTGAEFSVGSGFSAEERETFWALRDMLVCKIITYKSQKTGVAGAAPRFPVFKGFRHAVES